MYGSEIKTEHLVSSVYIFTKLSTFVTGFQKSVHKINFDNNLFI